MSYDPAREYLHCNPSLQEDAELALENLIQQELQLIKEAEQLFKRQVDHVKEIDRLQEYIPNISRIDHDIKRLSTVVDSSSELVQGVCSKFKRIDLAKVRLEDSLSKIGDILDLGICRDGMLKAMEMNNYEEAAMHIKRFLSIDQEELQKTITIICGEQDRGYSDDDKSMIDPKSMHSALGELDQARAKLLKLCQENMQRAIDENNSKDIERFFKIFPMLDEHQDCLHRYAEYLRGKVLSQHVNEVMNSKEANHADKLAALYENIAKIIDNHQPLIETYCGPGYLLVVLKVIQKECDCVSRKVLEEFRNETKLQSVAKLVRSSSLQTITSNATLNLNPPKLDPRAVDKILNEISLIISRSEVYLTFIVQRLKDDIESKAESESEKKASHLELYNMIFLECELNHLVQEVGGIYVMLEQFYLNESSKKAIVMDQIDTDPSFPCFISSMLDDIFFLIKKCTKRATSTKSNEVFCAIINHCVALLESTFCQVLEERLRTQQYYSSINAKNLDFSQAYNALQSGRYLQSANEQERSNAQYFSALNNLDKACDYTKTLRSLLDGDVRKFKPSILVRDHNNHMEKCITCLNEMSQLISRFSSIINSSLYQLFNNCLRSKMKVEFKNILDDNPELLPLILASPNELTTLARNLLKTCDSYLEGSLLPENYSKLVSISRDFLSSSLKVSHPSH